MSVKTGIGIDTGGTYTDAVVYNFNEKKVLAAAKALTTPFDLSIGILQALDRLPHELITTAEIIALSTTLATNACVEDRGGKAKLIFFGGDAKVIDEFGSGYGLPKPDQIHIQESYTGFYGEVNREPDWEYFEKSIRENFKGLEGAGIIEIYAMKNNAVIEKKAKEIFQKIFDIPVATGSELFSELNCLQRGSGALLNARLFPIVKEFLDAIKKSMQIRSINAPLVIVRSDGSLMSEDFAKLHPIETLLCGPAASAGGGFRLSGEDDCIIIDMGGTTSDISMVRKGIPLKITGGVSTGRWKTYLNGFYIKTIGLGGDSAVHYNGQELILEEYRAVPLCTAAAENPDVIRNLKKLAEKGAPHSLFLHEHFLLNRNYKETDARNEKEIRFLKVLEKGPLSLEEAALVLETDIYNINVKHLIKERIIAVSGLPPTDIMMIKNDFKIPENIIENDEKGGNRNYAFSKEASFLGAYFTALNLGITVDELCERVYEEVCKKLYINIVKTLLEKDDNYYSKNGINEDAERFILKSYEYAKKHKADGAKTGKTPLVFNLSTELTLVGVGAPVHVFLPRTAELLGAKAVIPEYAAIANALGAVTSRIHASFTADIRPLYNTGGITGYKVFGFNSNAVFNTMKEAEKFARKEAEEAAKEEACKRGAGGNLKIQIEENRNEGNARGGIFYMGSGITAHAEGELG